MVKEVVVHTANLADEDTTTATVLAYRMIAWRLQQKP